MATPNDFSNQLSIVNWLDSRFRFIEDNEQKNEACAQACDIMAEFMSRLKPCPVEYNEISKALQRAEIIYDKRMNPDLYEEYDNNGVKIF